MTPAGEKCVRVHRLYALPGLLLLVPLLMCGAPQKDMSLVDTNIVEPHSVYRFPEGSYFKTIDSASATFSVHLQNAAPDTGTENWRIICHADTWSTDIKHRGLAWYRFHFNVEHPEKMKTTGLLVPFHHRGAQFFFNGELIKQTRKTSPTGAFPAIPGKPTLITLPDNLWRSGKNVLALRTASLDGFGGFRGRILIGPTSILHEEKLRCNIWTSGLALISLYLALYSFQFYLQRRGESYYLFFAGISLFLGIWIIGFNGNALLIYDHYLTDILFTYMGGILIPPMALRFFHSFLDIRRNLFARVLEFFYYALVAWIALEYVLTGGIYLFNTYLYSIFINSNMIFLIYMFVVNAQAIRRKIPFAHRMMLALFLLAICVFLSLLSFTGFDIPLLLGEGYFLMTVVFATILARRFSDTHNALEKLARDKEKLAQILEKLARDKEKLAQDKEKLARVFARFVPTQFLNLLKGENHEDVRLGDAIEREMTVLYSDIRDFTTLIENLSDQERIDLINAYLGHVSPLIHEHEGIINKYSAAALMGLFPGQAEDAIIAAIQMQKAVHCFNTVRIRRGEQPIVIGAGIHTGDVLLSIIGEEERIGCTIISNTVNLASWLEGLTERLGATLLMSSNTFELLPDPGTYNSRSLGRVRIQGHKASVSVIEIFDGDPENIIALKLAGRSDFEAGLNFYINREFSHAMESFEKVLASHPEDRAARLYRERAKHYSQIKAHPGWDGSIKV